MSGRRARFRNRFDSSLVSSLSLSFSFASLNLATKSTKTIFKYPFTFTSSFRNETQRRRGASGECGTRYVSLLEPRKTKNPQARLSACPEREKRLPTVFSLGKWHLKERKKRPFEGELRKPPFLSLSKGKAFETSRVYRAS